jgi:hypothetical protein
MMRRPGPRGRVCFFCAWLTQLILNLALAFPLAFSRRSENNSQATRAELAQTVLTTHLATPKTDREPAFGERWASRASLKAQKFCL